MKFNQIKRFLTFVFFIIITISCIKRASAQENINAEIENYVKNAPFKMMAPQLPNIPNLKVDITSFGAVGDGHTLNTAAIAKAINECASKGGGIVNIPAGLWLTGPIELKSKINILSIQYLYQRAFVCNI